MLIVHNSIVIQPLREAYMAILLKHLHPPGQNDQQFYSNSCNLKIREV